MKTCKKCNTPLGHMHQNNDTCYKCKEPKNITRIPTEPKVTMTISQFKDLERKAAIGAKVEKLNDISRQTVLDLIEQMLR